MAIFKLSNNTFKGISKRNAISEISDPIISGTDPYAANVVFYMNGDLLGDKTGRHSVSSAGSAGLNSTKGSAVNSGRTTNNSIVIGHNTSSILTISNNLNDFNWTSTDWTVEYWILDPQETIGYCHILVADGQSAKGTFKGYTGVDDGRLYAQYFYSSNQGGPGASYNLWYPPNIWTHIAYERVSSSSTGRFYVNGKLRETSTFNPPGGTPSGVTMGAWGSESSKVYIDEFRVTRAAKYGGVNFTPRNSAY